MGLSAFGSAAECRKAAKEEVRALRNRISRHGSWDEIADDLFGFLEVCFQARLAVIKLREMDNRMHEQAAEAIARSRKPAMDCRTWDATLESCLTGLKQDLDRLIKVWRQNSAAFKRIENVVGLKLSDLQKSKAMVLESLDALNE